MRVSFAAATERGHARARNEDFYCAEPALGLFAVADGAGPDAGGWVASRTVIRALRQFVAETQHGSETTWPCPIDPGLSMGANRLRAGIGMANRSLGACAEQTSSGSSAAIGAVLFDEGMAVVASVGDCRIYLGREGRLTQMSADAHGRALHGEEPVTIEVLEIATRPGDLWLLCTDGLHASVADRTLAATLFAPSQPVAERARQFIDVANAADGRDNSTSILIEARDNDSVTEGGTMQIQSI